MEEKYAVRKSDGAVFYPSYSPDYGYSQSLADCLSGRRSFYFIRVRWQPRRFFKRGYIVQTDEVWEPSSGEFDVISEREARCILQKGHRP